MLTDNRLKIFVALAECGGFSAAARRLGISQPAVSQCIAQLEAESCGPLIVRGRAEVSLTPLGERFLLYARRILGEYESLSTELSGAPAFTRQEEFELGDGRRAVVCVDEGNIKISLK